MRNRNWGVCGSCVIWLQNFAVHTVVNVFQLGHVPGNRIVYVYTINSVNCDSSGTWWQVTLFENTGATGQKYYKWNDYFGSTDIDICCTGCIVQTWILLHFLYAMSVADAS